MWRRAVGTLADGGKSAVGRGHSRCTACHLNLWRAASRHAGASVAIDESPPLTPTGGRGSSTGRRRVRRPPWSCRLAQLAGVSRQVVDHRGASWPICSASASTASHPRTVWPPVGCPSDVYGAGAFVTSHMTASSQGARAIVLRVVVQWFVPRGWRTLVVCAVLVEPRRAPPPPPSVVDGGEGGVDASVEGVARGRQGPSTSCPAGRASPSRTASRQQRVSPPTATVVRLVPPKRRWASPWRRPCCASRSMTRLWKRCARAMVLLLWSPPSTRC
jgi:hypothetical protein